MSDINTIIARGIRFIAVSTRYDAGDITKEMAEQLLSMPLIPGGLPVDDSAVLSMDKEQREQWYINLRAPQLHHTINEYSALEARAAELERVLRMARVWRYVNRQGWTCWFCDRVNDPMPREYEQYKPELHNPNCPLVEVLKQ